MESLQHTWHDKPLIIVLMTLFVLLICLLLGALLLRSGVFDEASQFIGLAPTIAAIETTPEPTTTDTPKPATATATTIALATQTITLTPINLPTQMATSTAIEPAEAATATVDITVTATATPVQLVKANLLQDGDFETDISRNSRWKYFNNGSAVFLFANERWPQAIHHGASALRMTIREATRPDRFAGIFQQIPVIAGQEYILRLHGQIRSQFGDVQLSQYGYRAYYAIDWAGKTDWQAIPDSDWIELPWDEQAIDSRAPQFLTYETTLVPPGNNITIFVRSQAKWPLDYEAQFTYDELSLTGYTPKQALTKQSLPTTGQIDPHRKSGTKTLRWLTVIMTIALVIATIRRAVAQVDI